MREGVKGSEKTNVLLAPNLTLSTFHCPLTTVHLFRVQRYEGFSGVDDDCGVSVFIVPDCSRFVVEGGSLGSPEPVENGLDFAGCEGFSAVVVAHFLQFVPQHVVAAYHGHEVLDGGFGGAVGEVEEGEFFLGVGAGIHWF